MLVRCDTIIMTYNLAALRLHEICQQDFLPLVNRGPANMAMPYKKQWRLWSESKKTTSKAVLENQYSSSTRVQCFWYIRVWCAILIAKHGGSCVHFSGISTCRRTSPETVSHPQRQPLPSLYKISIPVYVIVINKRLLPLTTTLYDSLVLSLSLLKI